MVRSASPPIFMNVPMRGL